MEPKKRQIQQEIKMSHTVCLKPDAPPKIMTPGLHNLLLLLLLLAAAD